FPSGKTFLPIASYQNPVDIAAGPPPKPQYDFAVFSFSPDFRQMEVSIDWDITLFKGHIESEGIAEHFADAPNVGAINTTMSFPSIIATARDPPVITAFQDLRVGWKLTNNFLDHVTGIFNPRLLREEVQALD